MTEVVTLTAPSDAPEALEAALEGWWDALLRHAVRCTDANRLVADAWAETGRLIGHVQHADEPIGMDRGLRVTLRVPALATAVHEAGFSESSVLAAREVLFRAFERSRKKLAGEGRFATLWQGQAGCLWCEDGTLMAEPSLVLVARGRGSKRR